MARKIYIGFLKFVLKVSLPLMKKLQAKRKAGAERTRKAKAASIFPKIPIFPGPMAWVEYVKVFARETVYTVDKGAAELEAGLVSAVMKSAFSRQKKTEKRQAKKAAKAAKKKESKSIEQKTKKTAFLEIRTAPPTILSSWSLIPTKKHAPWNLSSPAGDRAASLLQSEGEGVRERKKGITLKKAVVVLVVFALIAILALANGATMGTGAAALIITASVIGTVLLVVRKIMKSRSDSGGGDDGGGADSEPLLDGDYDDDSGGANDAEGDGGFDDEE